MKKHYILHIRNRLNQILSLLKKIYIFDNWGFSEQELKYKHNFLLESNNSYLDKKYILNSQFHFHYLLIDIFYILKIEFDNHNIFHL